MLFDLIFAFILFFIFILTYVIPIWLEALKMKLGFISIPNGLMKLTIEQKVLFDKYMNYKEELTDDDINKLKLFMPKLKIRNKLHNILYKINDVALGIADLTFYDIIRWASLIIGCFLLLLVCVLLFANHKYVDKVKYYVDIIQNEQYIENDIFFTKNVSDYYYKNILNDIVSYEKSKMYAEITKKTYNYLVENKYVIEEYLSKYSTFDSIQQYFEFLSNLER